MQQRHMQGSNLAAQCNAPQNTTFNPPSMKDYDRTPQSAHDTHRAIVLERVRALRGRGQWGERRGLQAKVGC